jgi:hypothetical protein
MRLAGTNGHRLELTLLGYQFPTVRDDWHDANWLNIHVAAANDHGSWNATDASLLTSDVASLADWLDAVAEGRSAASEIDFTEPNLSFELVEASDRVRLRAWFELELRPRWAPWEEVPQRDLSVDLDVATDALRAAAASLRDQLSRFPPRASSG